MNTFSSPEARFWQERLRPGEQLLWASRPRVTLRFDRALVFGVGPAAVASVGLLWFELAKLPSASLAAMFADLDTYGIALGVMAILLYCFIYVLRTGLVLPWQQVYAITDRRLMVWRRLASPRLVEEEVGPDLKLERPRRPRDSVMFDYEYLYRPQPGMPGRKLARNGRRKVGFVRPQDTEGMERALARVLAGLPGRRSA